MKKFSFLSLVLSMLMIGSFATAQQTPERVVALEGSLAKIWTLAGGTLAGVTSDAYERGIADVSVECVGSVKTPNLEVILSLSPDLILASEDISSHSQLLKTFELAGIDCRIERVDTFYDYLAVLKDYCELTGRDDLYEENGTRVASRVRDIIEKVPKGIRPRALLLRAYSTGVKVKGNDNLVGAMLSELGCVNIAQSNNSLVEELSIEAIIHEDPDIIFISFMGDEVAAMSYLESGVFKNPAWQTLTAVKSEDVIPLPKELFHYKPNDRWDESYKTLYEALY